MRRKLSVILPVAGLTFALLIALVSAVIPAVAATNGSVTFGSLSSDAVACEDVEINYSWSYDDEVDDGAGHDYVALVFVDADGNVLDVNAGSNNNDTLVTAWYAVPDEDPPAPRLAARPITLAMFDIPDWNTSGITEQNSTEFYDWVIDNGTFMVETTYDPAAYADCSDYPLRSSAYSFEPSGDDDDDTGDDDDDTGGGGSSKSHHTSATPTPLPVLPSDGRINNHAGAPVAVYGTPLTVYGIDPETAGGSLVFQLSDEEIAAMGIPVDEPLVLATGVNPSTGMAVVLYRLPDGAFQLNTFYADGKPYQIKWYEGDLDVTTLLW